MRLVLKTCLHCCEVQNTSRQDEIETAVGVPLPLSLPNKNSFDF